MGKRTFARLAEQLLERGLSPDTACLLATGVSTPDQTLSRHQLGDLPAHLAELETTAPVLILYGALAEFDA
jgi:uroporphyrin-III C-methyltransferase